jgi:hypothetical protein
VRHSANSKHRDAPRAAESSAGRGPFVGPPAGADSVELRHTDAIDAEAGRVVTNV